ncbi:hypothetical protein GGQ87_001297 [Brevundimonas alba]|uniref:DGQHR domain-containing protein n=1 Tax=Brevundimonas alba TaxID=74314 RepID=A0A7X5YJY3_9CAUL|nr:DNA sulfur modification protein DndB [Brevundimonas alba]NJC41039.1 hypothetical protein [Brevundimonas alba]
MALTGTPIAKPTIKVFGMFGAFHVGDAATAKDKVLVRYFNTVASGKQTAASGDSLGLLRELKPMRERVNVSDLRDLSSLLQRELDDARVAEDLVPYLKGVNSAVGFFPGILVALVPKGFLRSEEGVAYPKPGAEGDANGQVSTGYDEYWTASRFKFDGKAVSLGLLEIDPMVTDLIVLDGQHRANAFRFATKTFDAVQSGETIYRAFYENVSAPKDFDSELPVTVVWFESQDDIEARLISRKLFVDVNMSARAVSESRRVLLDDRDRHSIVTGSVYRGLAQRAFDADRLSLLHTGFDCEEQEFHPLTLMLPSRMQAVVAYAAFGRDSHSGWEPSLKGYAPYLANYGRLKSIAPSLDEAVALKAERGDRKAFEETTAVLDEELAPKWIAVLEGYNLVSAHIEASVELDSWVRTQVVAIGQVWDKVFRGGEGLYGGFARVSEDGSGSAHTYKKAIDEISEKFISIREAKLSGCDPDQVRRAYDTFSSKAGLTGLFMAAHLYLERREAGWADVSAFVADLNKISAENWVRLLSTYKPAVVRELDPKQWPVMRAIILRALQGADPSLNFFDPTLAQLYNPDIRLIKRAVEQSVSGYMDGLSPAQRETNRVSEEQIRSWATDAMALLKDILAGAGLQPLNDDQVLRNFAVQWIESLLPKQGLAAAEAEDDDDPDEA